MTVLSPIVPASTWASPDDQAHEQVWQRAWASVGEPTHFSTQGTATARVTLPKASPEALAMPMRIAVTTETGGEVAGVDIEIGERVRIGSAVILAGSDASGLLHARLSIRPDNVSHSINLTFDPGHGTTPRHLLPVARFLDALRAPRSLTFWLHGHEAYVADPAPMQADAELFSEDLLPLIEMLARIQERLGHEFPMPLDPTHKEIGEIIHIDRLLRGETLQGSWTKGEMEIDREGLNELQGELFGPDPFPVDLTVQLNWEFRGESLAVGEVREFVRSARVADPESVKQFLRDGRTGSVIVDLIPGDSDDVERSLLDAGRRTAPFVEQPEFGGRYRCLAGFDL